jgi:uncharacterized protein YbjT (DUF2867 family)
MIMKTHETLLVTGATGYVGGELLKRLERKGHAVHCLVRKFGKLETTGPRTKVYCGDLTVRPSLWNAFKNVHTAYYLVHALREEKDFEQHEIQAAENFVAEARRTGVQKIIYLGALGNARDGLSPHLKSRQEVGRILRASGIPTLEFRASIVLGNGSLSFELIRDLTEHLPVMVLPRWLATKAQPIGIRDLLDYLEQALELEIEGNEIIEIGGADRMSYGDLMREYAHQRGITRFMLPVPVLTPWLSSHWIALFSRVNPAIGRKLIEGIKNPTVVESRRAFELFDIQPESAAAAIGHALSEAAVQKEHYVHAA